MLSEQCDAASCVHPVWLLDMFLFGHPCVVQCAGLGNDSQLARLSNATVGSKIDSRLAIAQKVGHQHLRALNITQPTCCLKNRRHHRICEMIVGTGSWINDPIRARVLLQARNLSTHQLATNRLVSGSVARSVGKTYSSWAEGLDFRSQILLLDLELEIRSC